MFMQILNGNVMFDNFVITNKLEIATETTM